uniref:Uncharacterized protein n=1 Tax=Sus scrofa TaxID=9823 RepID=A0A8D2C1H1_PIG
MVVLFLIFLRKFYTIFCSACTSLCSHQQCTRVPFSPHPHQYLLSLVLLMIDILTGVRRYLVVGLICISLMINDVEYPFIYLLAICMLTLEKYLFSSSVHFLFYFLLLSCISYLYILDINPLSDI